MERLAIIVVGIVQGVGFRPFVYNCAVRLRLGGFVKNLSGTVLIEVEGDAKSLHRFLAALAQPPPLAQIEKLTWKAIEPRGDQLFRIDASGSDAGGLVAIAPDVATCSECLAELFDPADRRYRYPFINCTNCGPRLTIVTGAPYDRARTTMNAFSMCSDCQAEYDNPTDRRFHAQPIACPACGPRLELRDAGWETIATSDPLMSFAEALRAGRIGALKGLGGYHLVCDARNSSAVSELRRRKHREEKSFAIMVRDVEFAKTLCEVGDEESRLLQSAAGPIVLLRKKLSGLIVEEVAPRNSFLGVMLPYTPLHHLLARAGEGMPLVMTSGNRSDEPIAAQDDEARAKMTGIADVFLIHNRPIHVRCDDSVTRVVDGTESPVRRSRGYAPRWIELPFQCPSPIGAVGGQFKATFALGRGRQAFLSHHMGDLEHLDAFQAFVRDFSLYENLFQIHPKFLAHDLHPDYRSTQFAMERSETVGSRLIGVQHHHAHMASCMVEHELIAPVIGVIFDGTGLGLDGAIWGGEFLVGDYHGYRRAAHLRNVGMPGGARAIHEPWRMAVAHVTDANVDCPSLDARFRLQIPTIRRMLERGVNTPLTSSAGRLFDAVAALVGVRDQVIHEGQAAIELEWVASRQAHAGLYPFEIVECLKPGGPEVPLVLDTRPVIRAIVDEVARGVDRSLIARRFHSTIAELIAAVCERIRIQTDINSVTLSGGVFLNALLSSEVYARLQSLGFQVYRHHRVPPSDGGLCLGQLAVAAASLRSKHG